MESRPSSEVKDASEASVTPGLALPLRPPYPPMEAARSETLPAGEGWQFEPKWDGFRALIFRDGDQVYLQSKAGQPLARYFPEIVNAVQRLRTEKFIIDGELVIQRAGEFSFDDLLLRIHPAASRIRRLALESPAGFYVFDILARGGENYADLPLRERRTLLADFLRREGHVQWLHVTPATGSRDVAQSWFQDFGELGLEGIMAKRLDAPYRSGKRDAMVKIKRMQTAECVVAGFRYQAGTKVVGSLLLGLYGDDGLLHHVGMSSAFSAADRRELAAMLEPLRGGAGFTGRAPGGPSRWAHGRDMKYVALKPELVCEVRYDYFSQGRFRHGTKFLRWRPEKAPRQCTFEQIDN